MNELEGMINGLMSNPDEMKKIMDIANSIMGGAGNTPSGEAPSQPTSQTPDLSGLSSLLSGLSSQQQAPAETPAQVPDLSGLSNLLGGLSKQAGSGGLGSLLGGLSQSSGQGGGLGGLGSLLGGLSSLPPGLGAAAKKFIQSPIKNSGDKSALFEALGPFLSEKRRNKLERAAQLAKMMNMGLGFFGKNGGQK